jgi:hypothetical protein
MKPECTSFHYKDPEQHYSDHSLQLMVHSSSKMFVGHSAFCKVGPALILKEMVCLLNTWSGFI